LTSGSGLVDEPISGKVATILNRRELVVNVGSEGGVQDGMIFAVLNRKGARIVDPDTGEDLGAVEIPKVLVRVVRVKPKLAVARTFRTTKKNIGGMGSPGLTGISDLFRPPNIVEVPETLEVKDKTYVEEIDEGESVVKVGDPVVQVIGDEFDALTD
jgi:hypothetical protein